MRTRDNDYTVRSLTPVKRIYEMFITQREKKIPGWRCPTCGKMFRADFSYASHIAQSIECRHPITEELR